MTTPFTPKPELMWKPDPNVEAARKLPEWRDFHRICGQSGVCFDHVERDGRRGAYRAVAMTPIRQPDGGYILSKLSDGDGPTVVAAIASAFERCGRTVPGAAEMLARGLTGAPAAEVDDLEALLGCDDALDDLEDLLG